MIYVFGDKFAKIFSLFKKDVVTVHSYATATVRDLTKTTNETRLDIERILKKNKQITCVIFTFGQLDLNLEFYSNIAQYKEHPIDNLCDDIKKYMDWIHNLSGKFKKIVLGIYPSPLDAAHTVESLVKYGTLTQLELDEYKAFLEEYASDLSRYVRYYEVLYVMKMRCSSKMGAQLPIYIDFLEYLLDEHLKVKLEYLDVDTCSIHLRWEPIVPLIIVELAKHNIQISNKDILDNFAEVEAKYLKSKARPIVHKKLFG